jgi:hypothetical protein
MDNKGLYGKYEIKKANGKPLDSEAKYFVLRYDKDPHAKKALEAYANSISDENYKLAMEIRAEIFPELCEGDNSSNEDSALPIQHVGQSLPDDEEIAKVVERIAYDKLAEEQIDDAYNKIGLLRQKLREWFNIKD